MTGSKAAACSAACLWLVVPASAQPPAIGQTPVPPLSLPSAVLRYDGLQGTPAAARIHNFSLLYGGELSVTAKRAQGSLTKGQFSVTDGARVHEADTILSADTLSYDGTKQRASATSVLLTQNPLTLQTPRLAFTPEEAVADDVRLAAVPPGVHADLFVRASQVFLYPERHKGEMRGASVYLFGGRLLTLRRVGFGIGGEGGSAVSRRQGVFPTAGVSGRFGPFVGFGGALPDVRGGRIHVLLPTRQTPQVRATARQELLRRPPSPAPIPVPPSGSAFLDSVRTLGTARKRPLPPNDPLLFHTLLPSPDPIQLFTGPPAPGLAVTEDVTSHLESSGRRRSELYVSRLPEVGLSGGLPLVRVSPPPPYGDPEAFRRSLRHLVPVLNVDVRYGFVREQRPGELQTNVRATRQQTGVGLSLAPLLVAPNTLLLPRALFTTNSYSKAPHSYHYTQYAAALEHDFSPRSALGVQFLSADTQGDSPFDFDVLDTSRELDVRLQMGNRRLTVAGEVRYDLRRGGVIEYRLSAASGLRGLTPVFSFNSRSRTVGVSAEIEGVTF